MSRLDLMLASRYLRSRRSSRLFSLITLIAAGGVTVGVAALVVVTGLMNGLQNEIRDRILVASPHIRILTYGRGLRLDDWQSVRDSVLTDPDVRAAAPFVLTQGLMSAGADYAEGVYVVGIDPDTGSASVTALPQHILTGDLRFLTDRSDVDGGVIVGSELGIRMSALSGEVVTLVSPAGSKFSASTGTFLPRWWTFEVVGRFETGMYEYDQSYVVMPLAQAQAFAGLGDAVSGLEVRIADPWDAETVGQRIVDRLGYPYRALTWQSQNAQLFSALKLEKLGMGLVVLLIVIVAAFNIVSMLTMLVRDKTREIGILRAMGLPLRVVGRIFVFQGVAIGAVGTILGAGLGLLIAWIVTVKQAIHLDPSVYFIDHLPVHVDPLDFVVIVLASLAVATLATIYPARQAAALHPVDAIRYE
jgi:lipoprotein-releasing system permease protein